ncbi:MAG: flavodoxin-dependent (E)-4-hydroxy-3-methylbut-2-enyl-diphosphate synthase [Chloroflexi bacterium]|nr:flavodoxin-dependent (E)-4-hydroxy-3-methylbut-2-enyl-diphosphate synthase [Chloroflexota bacterium]
MMHKRFSLPIQVGGLTVGGTSPVIVQSMTNTDTRNVRATVNQISMLKEAGCEIVRIAVPDLEAANALSDIKRAVCIPVIADIHFDYRLALEAIGSGVDEIRINPGNIGGPERVSEIVQLAKERQIPIRIGVNAGSLPKDADKNLTRAELMVNSAINEIKLLEDMDFNLIEISLKSFDVFTTVEANRNISKIIPYPLHLGITEAGLPGAGSIRSAVGLGILLYEGIGDSIRVSLSGDPVIEIPVAYEILKSLHLREKGPTLVACPSCGRADVDIVALAEAVDKRLAIIDKPVIVAVMGCEVNGPGEARDADVGVACGKGRGVIFRKGQIICTVEEKDIIDALMKEVELFNHLGPPILSGEVE